MWDWLWWGIFGVLSLIWNAAPWLVILLSFPLLIAVYFTIFADRGTVSTQQYVIMDEIPTTPSIPRETPTPRVWDESNSRSKLQVWHTPL